MKNKCKTNKAMQITAALFFIVLYATVSINAQSTTLQLPTTDNTSDFSINNNSSINLFKLSADGSLLSKGTYVSGTTAPSLGSGTRLWWYPKMSAFRVGFVTGTQWDGTNVGNYSFASGYNTTASGDNSTAMGYYTNASSSYSTAMGYKTNASGSSSTAMGNNTTASGDNSTAMGYYTNAISSYSTAMGYFTNASGSSSTAMGNNTTASGNVSTAMGYHTTASGYYSTAMGSYVATNAHDGSFIIGDFSTHTTTNSSAGNQMMMRFAGGYVLYTNADVTIGATLNPNQSSWGTVSDSTKKYAFLPVNGESVLNKISKFNLRSWSYKGQDSTKFRHYGPMAQEFFSAFGHDKYGIAGNDTTINQADFEGINLTAIHALIKRTDELKSVQKELKTKTEELALLKQKVNEQQNQLTMQQKQNEMQQNQLAMQQKQIQELNKIKTEFTVFKQAVNKLLINKNADKKIKLTMNK